MASPFSATKAFKKINFFFSFGKAVEVGWDGMGWVGVCWWRLYEPEMRNQQKNSG